MPDNLLSVKVGSAGKVKAFQIERDLICHLSPFIRDKLWNPWENQISLDKYEPVAFDLFSKWIHGHETPEVYISIQLSEEPWLSYGADICLLAMKLQCPNFEKEALSHFIRCCALAPFGPWAQIEREAPQQTPLRRFSNHWVAWNFYLSGCGKNEYTSLEAASFASLVTGQTRDPRIFDIEHWFSRCGDSLAPGCSHDPVFRQEKLQQKAVKRKPLQGPKELLEARQERALQQAGSLRESGVSLAESKTKAGSSTPSRASGTLFLGQQNPSIARRVTPPSSASGHIPRPLMSQLLGPQTPAPQPLVPQPWVLQPRVQIKPSTSVCPVIPATPARPSLSARPVLSAYAAGPARPPSEITPRNLWTQSKSDGNSSSRYRAPFVRYA